MKKKETGKLWSAVMLIIFGFIFLIQNIFPHINIDDFWPLLLIFTGFILIYDGYFTVEKNDDHH
jgi:formate hydrogenlyase subunit 3/multisubunit Na+/H+ antiporter MnhD subunit